MSQQKHTFVVPEGVAKCFWGEGKQYALGPGIHELDEYCSHVDILVLKPHQKSNTMILNTTCNPNSLVRAKICCIYSFRCEIANPNKYLNCNTLMSRGYNGESEEAIDGEDYVDNMYTNMIFNKFCTMTYEALTTLINIPIDLARESEFSDYQRLAFDNAGVKVTKPIVIITEIVPEEGA